jgi:hypothetical protein
MTAITKFEDLIAWQEARKLVSMIWVCFKRVERRNVPKVLPRNFAAFAATFGTV